MARTYELRKRAERQAATRRRIVEAAVELHTSLGPSQTSIAAIAERAGVQRHTVYAHFPSESDLFRACSQHWRAANAFPDPESWRGIADPERRLRTALRELYAWYERVEPALALFARDATLVPAQRELMEARVAQLAALADDLARGFSRRRRVRTAIGHALEFETWRSLVRRQGLSPRDAIDVMVRLVGSV